MNGGRGRIRLGVLGVGYMGSLHCRIATQIRPIDLVGVYDADVARAQQIAQTYETRVFDSVEHLFASVDAVVIAAPTSLHADLGLAALDHGLHTLIEKPIAATSTEARAIVDAWRRSGRVCVVGHTERYNATFAELQSVLGDEGPMAINIRRLNPFAPRITDADVTLDLLIHDIDGVLALARSEPTALFATGLRVVSDRLDHVDALLAFPSGTIASLTASRITEDKIRRIEVTAPGRYIVADLLRRTLTIHKRAMPEWAVSGSDVKFQLESVTQQVQVPAAEPLFLELNDFARAIQDGRPPRVGAEDGARALTTVERIRDLAERSAALRRVSEAFEGRPDAGAPVRGRPGA